MKRKKKEVRQKKIYVNLRTKEAYRGAKAAAEVLGVTTAQLNYWVTEFGKANKRFEGAAKRGYAKIFQKEIMLN